MLVQSRPNLKNFHKATYCENLAENRKKKKKHPFISLLFFFECFLGPQILARVRLLPAVFSLAVEVEVGSKPREIFSALLGATDPDSVFITNSSHPYLMVVKVKLTPDQPIGTTSLRDRAM